MWTIISRRRTIMFYLCIMDMELKGIRRVAKKKPTKRLVDVDNGEVIDVMEDDSFITIDSLPFVKVYVDEFAKAILGLTYPGYQVLSYVMIRLEKGNNLVYLTYSDVKLIIGNLGRTSYYKGLNELIKRNVIEPTDKGNIFRVNPNMIFNGVRISKFK